MRTRKVLCASGALLAIVLLLVVSCSKDKGANPAPNLVSMNGVVAFPDTSISAGEGVSVGLGSDEQPVGSDGAFTVKGNEHVPGLAVAYNADGAPLLMGIVPDPQPNLQFELDAHSTALALAFLQPFVCISNPGEAESVLVALEGLSELATVESLVTAKLSADPLALGLEDEQMDSALSRLVLAYLNMYPLPPPAELVPEQRPPLVRSAVSTGSGPTIEPSYTVSGLKLLWKGGNEYELSNNLGRWAFCCSPEDSFYVFPNGEFIDILKLSRPWPPSTRKFTMHLDPGGDTEYVEVFGYGFSSYPPNKWDSLTVPEQRRAHWGGMTTVCFELVSHTLAVICNTSNVYGKGTIASKVSESLLGFIFADTRLAERVVLHLKAGESWKCSWFLTKQILNRLATSASYRAEWASVTGVVLTQGMVGRLAKWLLVVYQPVVVFNSVTSVFKTVLGFENSWFKTSFAVFKEVEDFGSVRGQVADKDGGLAIAGATVVLAGDDNNPLNPAHRMTTGADGYYHFVNIGVGEKTITASKTGYKSHTITVTIEKDKEITAHITLERGGAGVSGRVLNDLLIHHKIEPSTFAGTVVMTARQIGGQHELRDGHAFDGSYTFSLPAGSWWVIASHDDYHSDSFQVTVPADGSVAAPRDLILKPNPTMSGHISLDMDNNGNYDQEFDVTFNEVGLSKPIPGQCPRGGGSVAVMAGGANRGAPGSFDYFLIGLVPSLIPEASTYPVGGIDFFGCASNSAKVVGLFETSRQHCQLESVGTGPMVFAFNDDPDGSGCNCGITAPGTFYLYEWGTELGDLVHGSFVADLAGWKTCHCGMNDTNGDGKIDHWDVVCSQAHVDVNFRFIVGTDYLLTWSATGGQPSSPLWENIGRAR